MKDLVKAKPENPIDFALLRLRKLQQELEGGSGGSGSGDEGDAEMTDAATKIQSIHRGKAARKEREEMTDAATKIQSIHRGKAARKQQPNIEESLLEWSKECGETKPVGIFSEL